MKPCYADGHISTGLIACLAFLIACWTICLGGGTQLVVHHDALWTRGAVPIRMLPNAAPGDHEHTRYDRNVTDLAVDFLREKSGLARQQTVSALLRIHASHTFR